MNMETNYSIFQNNKNYKILKKKFKRKREDLYYKSYQNT